MPSLDFIIPIILVAAGVLWVADGFRKPTTPVEVAQQAPAPVTRVEHHHTVHLAQPVEAIRHPMMSEPEWRRM